MTWREPARAYRTGFATPGSCEGIVAPEEEVAFREEVCLEAVSRHQRELAPWND